MASMIPSPLRLAAFACVSFSLGACIASGQVHSSAQVSAPDLVYINPDIQVIADYDEPIFYDRSYYWRNDGDGWSRSTTYTGGWVRVGTAPVAIQRIDHPRAYVHYHAQPVEAAARTSADAKQDNHEVQEHREAPRDAKPHDEGDEHRKHDHDDDDKSRKHR